MYRIFVIGAGFSRYGGLPLGNDLLKPILKMAKDEEVFHFFERDLAGFRQYLKWMGRSTRHLNLESFISYLDLEHFLGLKGSDTWSSSGNRTQLIVRNLIARILYQKQETMSSVARNFYDNFVSRLQPTDILLSLNYDTVVEEAMQRKNIPFRLFPTRYVTEGSNEVDLEKREVVLLKLHGSINWFDRTQHDKDVLYRQGTGLAIEIEPHWSIFSDRERWRLAPLVNGPYPIESPLAKIEVLNNMRDYILRRDLILNHPLIISPSFSKIVYLNPLREFWRSLGEAGVYNTEVVFIGFSFPQHDEYLTIPFQKLIYNFQRHNSVSNLKLRAKRLKIVDLQRKRSLRLAFQKKLPGIVWGKTDAIWDGFSPDTLDNII